MQARIKARNRIPYGGKWVYKDPFTGTELSAVTWDNMLRAIVDHRRANGAPIGAGLEDEVEQQLCINHPDECVDLDPAVPHKTTLNLWDVVRGTQVMMSFVANGRQIVGRSEAERRAQICLRCPYNASFTKPCSGICQELKNVVSMIVDQQGTQYDSKLHSCNICGCFLQASIWLRLEDQCKGVTDTMKKQFEYTATNYSCWKACT